MSLPKYTKDGRFTLYGALFHLHRDYLRTPKTRAGLRYALRHYPGDLAGYISGSWSHRS